MDDSIADEPERDVDSEALALLAKAAGHPWLLAAIPLVFFALRALRVARFDTTTAATLVTSGASLNSILVVATEFLLYTLGFVLIGLALAVIVKGSKRDRIMLAPTLALVMLLYFTFVNVLLLAYQVIIVATSAVAYVVVNKFVKKRGTTADKDLSPTLRLAVLLPAVLLMFALGDERPWMTVERITWDDNVTSVDYVVSNSEGWVTVLNDKGRTIGVQKSERMKNRQVCQTFEAVS